MTVRLTNKAQALLEQDLCREYALTSANMAQLLGAGISAGADAQTKRLVEWLIELCPDHEAYDAVLTGYLPRLECDDCWRQLQKDVGL